MTSKAWIRALGLVALSWSFTAHAQSVDPNVASAAELEALPGIGAKIATEIVSERERNGAFTSAEDLSARVPAMTASALAKARPALRFAVKPAPAGASNALSAPRANANDVAQVLGRFAREPSVRDVQVRVVEYTRTHPGVVDDWMARARLRGLAPRFIADGRGELDNDLRKVTNLDATSAEIESTTDGQAGRLQLRAQWELSRLIFEPAELAASREGVRLANLRDRVLEDVTRKYFERRRLQVELELSAAADMAERVRRELRLQELTADLDAATGGWFSEKLGAGPAP